MVNLASFTCGQKVLADRSILNMDKNWLKTPKLKHDISKSVTRQVNFIKIKIGGKCQN